MSRSVIAKLFYGSLIAIVIAIAVLGAAIAFGSSSFTMDGSDVVGIQSAFGWGTVAVGASAVLVIVAASVAQFVAWIGALINTAPLENKTWFVILLVSGLLGFGLIAMLVYLLTEPHGPRAAVPAGSPAAA
ncbi:hypothetical protein [Mycetocola miduiensis]|uniref:Uncharacterized protein n=1 Tax=Mycetocola miduiensis TaxID=995034 RepID=A0A1I4ZWC3_9MICO|nr:hypothetical protein [Mycetocola miduiensis]SFN54538.1 hypothetical protein SAMN05216219_1138 [Mycetocola miduiensis]